MGCAWATQGVPRLVRALSHGAGRCVDDGGARVPEVFTAAKLEGVIAWVVVADLCTPNRAKIVYSWRFRINAWTYQYHSMTRLGLQNVGLLALY